MKFSARKNAAILLALAMLLPTLASCSESKVNEADEAENTPVQSSDVSAVNPEDVAEEEEVDPFADVNFDGRTFYIDTSINSATVGVASSNYLIEGYEEMVGDQAPDAAFQRNLDVMNRLNVALKYNETDIGFGDVASHFRTLISSGDSTYQLIVNDVYGLTPLTAEGLFYTVDDGKNFDFTQGWWYNDFMTDVSFDTSLRFFLAGDYFIDQIRCTHCLIMNKDIYRDTIGDPNDVYNYVLEKTWTFDKFREIIDQCYRDLNGNGVFDKNDQYGHIANDWWGPNIAWIISGDPGFIDRDENGLPLLAVNNERSYELTEKLCGILHSDAAAVGLWDEQGTIDAFTAGQALFIGYLRLGSLESEQIRSTDIDIAILPYPMLDELSGDYMTATHDTAELGSIPSTVDPNDLDFISTVVEVLCRETNKQVLPAYYESSLKIKYTRDDTAAQMIDIIHDHYGNGFALTWQSRLSGILMQNTFSSCVENNNTDFASKYKTLEKAANKLLAKYVDQFAELKEERYS